MLLTFQSLKTNLTCTGFHIFEAAATVLPRCRGVGCLQPRARPMAPVFSPAESTGLQPVLGACIPPDGQFPAPVTHPPSGLQFWVTRVVRALFPHTSLMTSAAAWQTLFINFYSLPTLRSQGHVGKSAMSALLWAFKVKRLGGLGNAILLLKCTRALLHTRLSTTRGMLNCAPGWNDYRGEDEHKFISKQHGKSWKRLLLLLFFPSREKRWLLPQLYGGEGSKQFLSLATI